MPHHTFVPDVYYTTIGLHEPVLEIAPGDTVSTKTVDAAGYDEERRQVTTPGNPMTGPFSVSGAQPGDTLVVVFESIVPNRTRGFTSPRISAGVLDPGYPVTHAEATERCAWEIDPQSRTARLVEPESQLSHLALPIAPMLGCFGVAPGGGQTISTATSSTHGGNMDYRGFAPGVTVYLPVRQPGALFFLGDGHALQGDGEIVGTGIEISMDVTFGVGLLRDRPISWPRAENAEYIMTIGNARPLDQCVQHATTEMLRWLGEQYGLAPLAAHSLLGQCVEYDLGNMFDPAYTMVCKLRKSLLAAVTG
jgi:amidase